MLEDPVHLVVSAMLFSSVFLMVWSLFRIPVKPEPPITRRIAIELGLEHRQTIFEQPVIGQLMGISMLMAQRFPFFRDKIRQDLEASGNPSGYSVDEYVAICIASGIGTGVVSTLILFMQLSQFDLLMVLVMPIIGFAIPMMSLSESASSRTKKISRKLPYTMDLIALMMEAGATFTEAINTLIHDEPDDELNQELRIVQSEIEFGATRAAALFNMAERIPLDSLRSVVGAINQAEALGTPLSLILKNQAEMIRMLRGVRAEEASASASMKILLPSMLILAAVVLIVFSPIILQHLAGELTPW